MSPNTFPPDGGSPLSSPRLKSGASRGHSVNLWRTASTRGGWCELMGGKMARGYSAWWTSILNRISVGPAGQDGTGKRLWWPWRRTLRDGFTLFWWKIWPANAGCEQR